ncbi:MAG: hypothetical protein ACFFCQ_08025 [Promethearchaeota archaeon]
MTKNKYAIVLAFIFLAGISFKALPVPVLIQGSVRQNEGSFMGFDWSYGTIQRTFTRSLDIGDSFSETKTDSTTKSYTMWANIITDYEVLDVFWERWTNRSKAAPSVDWEAPGAPQNWRGYRADGFLTNGAGQGGAWFRYTGITVNNWGPTNFFGQSANYSWFGRRIDVGLAYPSSFLGPFDWQTSYAELNELENETIPIKNWLGFEFGMSEMPKYQIDYIFDHGTPANTADDEVVFQELLIPKFIKIRLITQAHQVDVEETFKVDASLSGAWNFSGSYTEDLNGYNVQIKDGDSYWFDYFALTDGVVDYQYEGGFNIEGRLSTNLTRTVTYHADGTPVPENVRPLILRSLDIVIDGEWDFSASDTGTLEGEAAFQSILQVILTLQSTSTKPDLAVWGNFVPGRVIGYSDVDGDDILTTFLNESMIATPDAIMAFGITEGAHIAGTFSAEGYADGRAYTKFGDTVLVDKSGTVTRDVTIPYDFIWGYDPDTDGPDNVDFTWNTPSEDNGNAVFSWDVTYDNTPMTWWINNGTAESIIHDDTDLSYGYQLALDAANGEAVLTTTYEQSGIQDPTLKETISTNELSLARYKRDYYLSMTQVSDDASGALAEQESQLETTVAGKDLFSQNFGGSKETYHLANDQEIAYNAGTSVMNLLTAEGRPGEPTNVTQKNPFTSPITKHVAAVLTYWTADGRITDVNWILRENLVITSYPTWNGEGIVHDPEYVSTYTPNEEHDYGTQSTSKEKAPAFGFLIGMSVIAVLVVIRQKRK